MEVLGEVDTSADKGTASSVLPRGRGCIGTVVSSGCGCLAFVVGAVVAIALFAPQLLSGWGARVIEKAIEARIDGRVEVNGVHMSWGSEQKASSVRIFSTDNRMVLDASLEFPALLEWIRDGEGEERYGIHIHALKERVNPDGTSDLGRTLRIDRSEGSSVLLGLLNRAQRLVSSKRASSADRSVRLSLFIDEGEIYSPATGQETPVKIEDVELVATSYRGGASFDLRRGVVRGPGIAGGASVELKTSFALGDGRRDELVFAKGHLDPIPARVLRTLGVLGRGPERQGVLNGQRLVANVYDKVAPGLTAVFADFVQDGLTVDLEYGTLIASEGPIDEGAEIARPIKLSMVGPLRDSVHVDAKVVFPGVQRGAQLKPNGPGQFTGGAAMLVGESALGEPAALRIDLLVKTDPVARMLATVAPSGAIAIPDGESGAWEGEARSFRIPIERDFFHLAPARPATRRRGSLLASILRKSEIDLAIAGKSSHPVTVSLAPMSAGAETEEGSLAAADLMPLTHVVTRVVLRPLFGGSIDSSWQYGARPDTFFRCTLPGRTLGTGDPAVGRVDVVLSGVPKSFLERTLDVPPNVLRSLPSRFHRIDVRGVPLDVVLGDRRSNVDIEVEVHTEPDEMLKGRFADDTFSCKWASFDLDLDPETCEDILLRVMPWLSQIESVAPGARVEMTLTDFEFRFEGEERKESGTMQIRCDPLRVRLDPMFTKSLVKDLRPGPDEWITWAPGLLEFSLSQSNITYKAMELPLSNEDIVAVTGNSFDGGYNLRGRIRGAYVSGVGGEDMTVPATISTNSGVPQILINPLDLDVDETIRIFQERLRKGVLENEDG